MEDHSNFHKLISVSKGIDSGNHESFSCAILAGRVKCWGRNLNGQLGQEHVNNVGDVSNQMGSNLPPIELDNTRAVSISSGYAHSCALFENGKIKCWGQNDYGQLGYEDTDNRGDMMNNKMGENLPYVDLGGLEAVQVSVGFYHSCALLKNRKVKCWGRAGTGQLGYENLDQLGDGSGEMGGNLPEVDLGDELVYQLVAGGNHNCVILQSKKIKCWGNNLQGQLGYEDSAERGDDPNEMGDNLPYVDLGEDEKALLLSASPYHTCALLEQGKIKCWGFNSGGQLGQGHSTAIIGDTSGQMGDNLAFTNVSEEKVIDLTTGTSFTCALLESQNIKCWGNGGAGKLGYENTNTLGTSSSHMGSNLNFVNVGTGLTVQEVRASYSHTCALLSNDSVKCWGGNNYGQLGQGNMTNLGESTGQMGDALLAISL
ncbi:MAG: hypothetical protein KDD52_02530 [Bdellovibrionales bacterium]|nr:hypothetical protein [Bdellovibrionales bacterium]